MKTKALKKAIKRVNKDKSQIETDMAHQAKVAHIKEIVRSIFPIIEGVETIYDAQTVVNALSGFIAAHIEDKVKLIKLNELPIDLGSEEESKIKTAILGLMELLKDESAQEVSETLERFGTTLQQYVVHTHMVAPMSTITIDDLVSK